MAKEKSISELLKEQKKSVRARTQGKGVNEGKKATKTEEDEKDKDEEDLEEEDEDEKEDEKKMSEGKKVKSEEDEKEDEDEEDEKEVSEEKEEDEEDLEEEDEDEKEDEDEEEKVKSEETEAEKSIKTEKPDVKDEDEDDEQKKAYDATQEAPKVDVKKDKTVTPAVQVKEDVQALLKGESLSEEFKTKAKTVLEAAVARHVKTIESQLHEVYTKAYNIKLQEETKKLRDKLDTVTEQVAAEYCKENELVIEQGLRIENYEKFVSGMKELFENCYCEVPENKIDLYEELKSEKDELEQINDKLLGEAANMRKRLIALEKSQIVNEALADLTEVEKERLKSLVEEISFTDAKSYRAKVEVIKDNYFENKSRRSGDISETDASGLKAPMSSVQENYLAALDRHTETEN